MIKSEKEGFLVDKTAAWIVVAILGAVFFDLPDKINLNNTAQIETTNSLKLEIAELKLEFRKIVRDEIEALDFTKYVTKTELNNIKEDVDYNDKRLNQRNETVSNVVYLMQETKEIKNEVDELRKKINAK